MRHIPVQDAQREIAGRDERQHDEGREQTETRARVIGDGDECRDDERGEQRQRAQIKKRWVRKHGLAEPLARARPIGEVFFQLRAAVVDQVVADVRVQTVGRFGCLRSHAHGCVRHVEFGRARAFADALDNVAVAVARGEVHPRIDAGRVSA